ncbi:MULTISPECIES: hypothetical protein [Bacillaceae]|uniref:Uncharacterized protein n=1 Tax=Evansella alkalicola TaxID=745819 RepID=A0ABS6JQV4_9BACI|nr:MULTISPECIES: hypothetical protein [Bacillaceae]MBU9720941.1 hypothetical protein [Bacillus alkalicola]
MGGRDGGLGERGETGCGGRGREKIYVEVLDVRLWSGVKVLFDDGSARSVWEFGASGSKMS